MTLFLISKTIVMEHQMLVQADNIIQANLKALGPANQGQWRELDPREMWAAEALQMETCDPEQEDEFPEVVE